MRTTPLLATAWAGAATVAVGLGFFAVGLLDADPVPASAATAVTTPAASPAATPVTSPSASTTVSPEVSPPAPLTGQQVTEGGTVYGSCVDGALQLGSAPAAGWEVDDSSTATAVELKGGDRRIHVTAICGPAGPVFTVTTDGDDDSPAVTPAPAPAVTPAPAPAVTPAPSSTSPDDGSDDHGSGGHGSDD